MLTPEEIKAIQIIAKLAESGLVTKDDLYSDGANGFICMIRDIVEVLSK